MSESKWAKWVWYGVLAAVVTGLFAPVLTASAGGVSEVPRRTCTIPER